MSKLINIDFRSLTGRQQRGSSLLGLALHTGRLEGVVLRRTNGSVQLQKSFSVALSLDPLTNAPELVGREIRNLLNAEGVRERRCILALPLKWALTIHTKIPDLPEADIASFLQIEAERGFPCDPATLVTGISRYQDPQGEQHATIVGVPRNHVTAIENVLQAAQLKPASFSLGLPALQPPGEDASRGVLALAVGDSAVDLQVASGGGIAALRALEGALELESGQRRLRADLVVRETRITLGQLPPGIRDAVRRVRVFGPRDLAQQLADEIDLRLEAMNLEVQVVETYGPSDFSVHVPMDAPVSAAFSLAAHYLAGRAAAFEFLPPKVSAFEQFAARYSSGKLQRAGIAAGALLFVVACAFLFQQWQLFRLQTEWAGIRSKVTELKDLQRNAAQFRPWFDESFRGLTILRRLTEAFPEDGSVTAKILEIRDPGIVTCTGSARDYQALLKTVERLRATAEIPDVSLGQTRGKSPALQFTFSFAWNEGGRSGN